MVGKRIIICGPTCSGKTFLRDILEKKGFTFDISYTSRLKRKKPREINGVHYYFISRKEFEKRIFESYFYEWVEYEGNYYGTGLKEWSEADCFIMETDGIKKIDSESRKNSFIIYLNPPIIDRIKRMRRKRKWSWTKIYNRMNEDKIKFKNFKNYDIVITNANF